MKEGTQAPPDPIGSFLSFPKSAAPVVKEKEGKQRNEAIIQIIQEKGQRCPICAAKPVLPK